MMSRLKFTVFSFILLFINIVFVQCDSREDSREKVAERKSLSHKSLFNVLFDGFSKQMPDRNTNYQKFVRDNADSSIKTQRSFVSAEENNKVYMERESVSPNVKNTRVKRSFVSSDQVTSSTPTVALPDHIAIVTDDIPSDLYEIFDGIYNESSAISENNNTNDETSTFSTIDITSLAYAEKLLDREDAQGFLNSFKDDFQRNVVITQLLFCPHIPLCYFSYNLSYDQMVFESPCEACLCENCETTDRCCPDILHFANKTSESETGLYRRTECLPLSLKQSDNTFETVSKCPASFNQAYPDTDLCLADRTDQTFSDILPVTDTTNNITYKNRQCATCNGVLEEHLAVWQPEIICVEAHERSSGNEFMTFVQKSEGVYTEAEFIQFVQESKRCNVIYNLPTTSIHATFCYPSIGKCNTTGNWAVFDPFISSACSLYENDYTVKTDPLDWMGTTKYRNIFCALCNGETPDSVLLYRFHFDGGAAPQPYAFSGLLKFGGIAEESPNTEDLCERGFVYDSRRDVCLELTCGPLTILRNKTCEPMFSQMLKVVYKITIRLYPDGGWKDTFNNIGTVFQDINDYLEMTLQSLLSGLNLLRQIPDYGMYFYTDSGDFGATTSNAICHMKLFLDVNGTCTDDVCPSEDLEQYFEVDFNFYIDDWHNLKDIIQLAVDFEIVDSVIFLNQSSYTFKIQVRDFGWREYSPANTKHTLDFCPPDVEVVSLSKQKTCPFVSIPIEHNDCLENKAGLICPSINIVLNVSDYYFGDNGSSLFVCSEVYLNQTSQATITQKPDHQSSDVSVILSLVCCIISLVCLLLSFITFCLFPRLRTLPGKNNMALILSLFIAQVMFLVSSFGKLQSGSFECMLVGLLTHFFWLLAIFWMNICTFHVFRVFTGIEALAIESEFKSFSIYFAYTIALPACLVIINILVSLLSTNMKDFGYGKSTCYISSEKMVNFTFGLPVGYVIITNLIMFLFFVVKIKTSPVVQKDVKNERNDIIIFAKLSTLTGFTWIFGFIYSWTDIGAFSYLFILLNASQGVFLFLSFVCNKRVIDMYRNRSFGVTSSSESYRTRIADSRQSSTVKKV